MEQAPFQSSASHDPISVRGSLSVAGDPQNRRENTNGE